VHEEADEELEVEPHVEARVSTSAYDDAGSTINVGSYEISHDDIGDERETLKNGDYAVSGFFGVPRRNSFDDDEPKIPAFGR